MQSRVDFPRMREIFFAQEQVLGGEGHFVGTFHLFKGGRELKGDFTSGETRLNGWRFPRLDGSLLWVPDRFEVTNASSDFYGGRTQFTYGLKPLGGLGRVRPRTSTRSSRASTSARWARRSSGRASARPAACPAPRACDGPSAGLRDRNGDGTLTVAPSGGVALLGRDMPADAGQRDQTRGAPGSLQPDPVCSATLAVGGEIDLAASARSGSTSRRSWMATRSAPT